MTKKIIMRAKTDGSKSVPVEIGKRIYCCPMEESGHNITCENRRKVKDGICPKCRKDEVLVKMDNSFICQKCWEKEEAEKA